MGRPKIYSTEEEKMEAQRIYNKTHYYKTKNRTKSFSELSSCQEEAREAIEAFVADINKRIFLLTGNAGTGKTFLVCQILLPLFLQEYKKIFLLAPTNKAVDVLRKKIDWNISKDNIEFKTLAQFYNSKERFDTLTSKSLGFAPAGLYLFKCDGKEYYINENIDKKDINIEKLKISPWMYCNFTNETSDDLIIIDEASMVTELDFNLLMHRYKNYKILFLGDLLQLPPINTDRKDKTDRVSLIFDQNYNTVNMTTILRTKEKDISEIYELTRNFVSSTNPNHRKQDYILKNLQATNKIIKKIQLKDSIKDDLMNGRLFCILSHTNAAVTENQNLVISCLNSTKICKYGYYEDVIYVMTSYYDRTLKNNKYFKLTNIINSDFVIDDSVKVPGIELETDDKVSIRILDMEHYKIVKDYIDEKIKIITNKKKMTQEQILEQKILIKYYYNLDEYIKNIYHNDIEGAIASLKKILRTYMCRGQETFQLSFATTVHKAQGSGFEKIYLDISNIYSQYTTPISKSKLLYVGTTRAEKDIAFF